VGDVQDVKGQIMVHNMKKMKKKINTEQSKHNIKMKIKNTILGLIGGGLLSACALSPIYIPHETMLRQIENITYNRNNMNCVDKAILYHKTLRSQGIESNVVTGFINGDKSVGHAWVEVFKDNKTFVIDPTWPYPLDGWLKKYYPERKVEFRYDTVISIEDYYAQWKVNIDKKIQLFQ